MEDADRKKIYRHTFFGTEHGLLVFEDLLRESGYFDKMITLGDIPSPDTNNDYYRGRESIFADILEIMGITGLGQEKQLAAALADVVPSGKKLQEDAEGEK